MVDFVEVGFEVGEVYEFVDVFGLGEEVVGRAGLDGFDGLEIVAKG